jgi:hypothetical protein
MPSRLDLHELAYRIWEIRGRPDGAHRPREIDWFTAKRVHHQIIAEAAYLRWLGRGRPFGDSWNDWFFCETVLFGDHQLPEAFVDERARHQATQEDSTGTEASGLPPKAADGSVLRVLTHQWAP